MRRSMESSFHLRSVFLKLLELERIESGLVRTDVV